MTSSNVGGNACARDDRAPTRGRRSWLVFGGLVLFAAAGMTPRRPLAREPTVGDFVAMLERVNHRPPNAPAGHRAIDYAHVFEPEGSLYHGTLSDLDGSPKATWTFDAAAGKVTVNERLSLEQLDALVASFDEISQFRVTDPRVVVDPRTFHVIALMTDARTAQARIAVYLVPDSLGSPKILKWLERFRVPRRRAGPSPTPATPGR